MKAVYVTRDSDNWCVEVWGRIDIGIRKFHGCVTWGTARIGSKFSSRDRTQLLEPDECREQFGFYPRAGTAWYITTKGKRTKVDIAFSP